LAKDRGSKLLQSNTIELTPAISPLTSLDKFLDECRRKFDYYEQQAGDRCGSSTYKSESQRVPKRTRYLSDGDAKEMLWKGCRTSKRLKSPPFMSLLIN